MKQERYSIAAILAGDTGQYRTLVERYQNGLIIHIENMVQSRVEAEDIAQESFIKAYENLSNFDPEKARFSTWLYRIATNKAIDYLRVHNRVVQDENIEELADEAAPIDLSDDEVMALRHAVETLEPPVYAQVIRAYFWEGKSYQTIAAELDVPTSTIGTWIRRAKVQLRKELV